MSIAHGQFVWYELLTSDRAAAEAFYAKVLGWSARDSGMTDITYTLMSAGDTGVAGMMELTEEMRGRGVPPCWTGYVDVTDIVESRKAVEQAGGAVRVPVTEIPGVGHFAIVSDPQGAVFALFQQDESYPAPSQSAPGHVGWHELYCTDQASDFEFYATLFGWTKSHGMDMGPMGTYQIFAYGGTDKGGMMNRPPQMPVSAWNFYFNVPALDAAMERITQGGGQIFHGPIEVPGGSWIAQATDPQGAFFSIVAPHR